MSGLRCLKPILASALLLAIVACSSSGKVNVRQDISNPIPRGKTVVVDVKSRAIEELSEGDKEEIREAERRLRAQLFGRLVAEGVFRQALQPGEVADYNMEVTLTSAEEVSGGARVFLGVLAGANSLTASVELFEMPANTRIADFSVEGESASHPFSSESDLDDAIREAVTKIIAELQS